MEMVFRFCQERERNSLDGDRGSWTLKQPHVEDSEGRFCFPHIDINNIAILALPARRLRALELMLKLSDFDSVPALLIIRL